MESQLLFVIPVYASTEDAFESKWKVKIDALKGIDASSKKDSDSERFPWKYNQIAGVVEIYANPSKNDIEYVVFKRQGNVGYNYIPRCEMTCCARLGNHFRVLETDSNEKIRGKIMMHLRNLLKTEFNRRFLDLELFETQFAMMNVRGLFYH